ncbi:MAG: O-methyltransferase [Thermoanaerobaculia bacterium]|nr:O-methyltransferase [Thermoanaerobaculia bacterium]
MKAGVDAILRRAQAEYLDSLLPESDALLALMERVAADDGHPIADREVAQLMRVVLATSAPKRILEIGTNIGYSVVVMGRACPDARIETIEIDGATLRSAEEFARQAGIADRVTFHHGAALEVLSRIDGPWDFVFIDCVKTEYSGYLDAVSDRLAPGAVVFVDNLLWGGQVAEGAKSDDQRASTDALRAFNQRFVSDPNFVATIVAVGDGVGIAVKR